MLQGIGLDNFLKEFEFFGLAGNFLTTEGQECIVPTWFYKNLPGVPLEGCFYSTSNITDINSLSEDNWKEISFKIYDLPFLVQPIEKRIEYLRNLNLSEKNNHVVPYIKCEGNSHALQVLEKMTKEKADGIILRKPKSFYEQKRDHPSLLRGIIRFQITAKVVACHVEKKKKDNILEGLTLSVKEHQFEVKSLSDAMKSCPPPAGTQLVLLCKKFNKQGEPQDPIVVDFS